MDRDRTETKKNSLEGERNEQTNFSFNNILSIINL